ncbi:MAG: J domain-containing protein [Cyanobacteriota bacterium]|nr:J domain-containing protein [Cyanobacteriota bacterium]
MPRKASPSSRRTPKTSKTTSQTSETSAPLALSQLHLRLDALDKEHQRLLKQIKKKRTELKNFVEQMRSLATEVFHQGISSLEKMADIDREIHALFDEILTKRKFGQQTRKKIEAIYANLQSSGIVSPQRRARNDNDELDELFESEEEDDFFSFRDENARQKREQQKREFRDVETPSAPRTEESRKIRQTFLRLAEIFHPDRVTDSETQKHHTEIMKEINKAYKEGDLARLIELEQKHEVGETIDTQNEDEVTRRCKRLEQQNELLKRQYENLKEELRQVKRTPEGEMVSDYRKKTKQGIDPIAEMLEEVEEQVQVISEVRDFVRDFSQKKLTIKDFLKGPPVLHRIVQDVMEDMFDEIFEDFGGIVINFR